MAVSKTSLVNMALTKIGRNRLTDFDSDTSEEAIMARLIFDEVRDEITEEGPWTFAIKRVELGQLSSTPEYEFDYEFQLPVDLLRVIEINETFPGEEAYRIEGRKLLGNDTSMEVRYLAQVTDVSQWSAGFKRCFILRMAAEMSYAFRADKALTQGLFEQYQDALERALATDGKQGSNDTIQSRDLIEVR